MDEYQIEDRGWRWGLRMKIWMRIEEWGWKWRFLSMAKQLQIVDSVKLCGDFQLAASLPPPLQVFLHHCHLPHHYHYCRSKCHHDDYHNSRHLLLLIMIATRESVREVGGLTQSSTCSHSITSSLSYSLLWWCHHNNNLKFDNYRKIITTSPFLNVQLALTSVSSSRTSLTYEWGRDGQCLVANKTRRFEAKLNRKRRFRQTLSSPSFCPGHHRQMRRMDMEHVEGVRF